MVSDGFRWFAVLVVTCYKLIYHYGKLRSFKEMEKENANEQEERRMEQIMMEMQLHMKKKKEDKAIKSDCDVLKVNIKHTH